MLHVSLAVLGGARGSYTTTLKAVCYSSSATAFNVFPVCGAAIGAVWQVVVQVIGMRELHRTSTARAFWAWFLPFVVAVCLAGALCFRGDARSVEVLAGVRRRQIRGLIRAPAPPRRPTVHVKRGGHDGKLG